MFWYHVVELLSPAMLSLTELISLAARFSHTLRFSFSFDAIECWPIEDWVLLTALAIEGVLLGWLVVGVVKRVFFRG